MKGTNHPAAAFETLESRLLLSTTYYVADPRGLDSVTGTADDVRSSDTAAGTSLSQPFATLGKAAGIAKAGDTVLIRGGQYNQTLTPANSGTAGAPITFKNYNGEKATITGDSLTPGIDISGRNYITIDGLTVDRVQRWMYALTSTYNVIQNCTFSNALDAYGSAKAGLFFQNGGYNKVLNNTIDNGASDSLALVASNHNLIDGNSFHDSLHTLWTVKAGNYNVLRNNYFYNSIQKIGEIYDAVDVGFDHDITAYDATHYNVVENNVFALTASSGNASPFAGIQFAAQNSIIRNNVFYDTQGPALDLTYYLDEAQYNHNNRIYNNDFSQTDFAGINISGGGGSNFTDNQFKNNILQNSRFVANDTRWPWYTDELAGKPVQTIVSRSDGFTFDTNNFYSAGGDQPYLITNGQRSVGDITPPHTVAWWNSNQPSLYTGNLAVDAGFVNEDGHDFHLKSTSAMIDKGTFLTKTTTSGSGTVISVQDAGWFRDGYGIPGVTGDMIQLEGQSTPAQVIKVDYTNNTLTLDRSITWQAGKGVSLQYSGARPDLGAFEYASTSAPVAPKVVSTQVNGGAAQRSTISDVSVQFSTNVGASLTSSALSLLNTTTGQTVSLAGRTPMYNATTNTARCDLTGLNLPDGSYTATLSAAIVKNATGVALDGNGDGVAGDNYVFKFHRLAGDATGDGKVDVADLGVLGGNYGQTGQAGMSGDLNGDGRVDVGDLGILGMNYGRVLPL